MEVSSTSLITLAGSSRGYRFQVNMDRDAETKQKLYDKLSMNETELTKATSTLQSKDDNTVNDPFSQSILSLIMLTLTQPYLLASVM